MRVHIPSALYSYTGHAAQVDAVGATVDEVLRDLDARHPGLRFRIIDEQDRVRRHIKVCVNTEQVFDLERRLRPSDEIYIIMALSGGAD